MTKVQQLIDAGKAGALASRRAARRRAAAGPTQGRLWRCRCRRAFPATPRHTQSSVCCCAPSLPPAFAMFAPLTALLALAACSARTGPRMQIRRSSTPWYMLWINARAPFYLTGPRPATKNPLDFIAFSDNCPARTLASDERARTRIGIRVLLLFFYRKFMDPASALYSLFKTSSQI